MLCLMLTMLGGWRLRLREVLRVQPPNRHNLNIDWLADPSSDYRGEDEDDY